MERLQAALEKARARRGDSPARPQRQAGIRSKPPARGEAWDAIPMVELPLGKLPSHRVVTAQGGKLAQSFDLLRTKMLQQMRTHRWKRVAITSPGGGCGKTTIAANLAVGLTRQSDITAIVLDLDLRRPSMAKLFGFEGTQSCWQVLGGEVPFEEQALRISDNVIMSLNHHAASNPAEILSSQRAAEIVDEIEATYRPDVILFDMPPMLATDDNIAFMRNAHCAILVAGAESTTIAQVDACERDLAEQTNVMGVVLNKCRYMGESQEYGYY